MKKFICLILITLMIPTFPNLKIHADSDFQEECSAVVLMEASTGKILYGKNIDTPMPPASVTKIMTLLLIMEAIDERKINLDDDVQVSETAAQMGGSQIFLEVGEQMKVDELIKAVTVASANDAAAALAEYHSGSIEAFVEQMNAKAKELKMLNTNFENCNGLDDTTKNHVTSAKDIAIMSKALLKYDLITKYSTIWMDTVRNGTFGLTNTNRLIRFYKGANGLKTGYTSQAGFCISATAKREDMQLIAVVMGAKTRDTRNKIATKLLDYGFANFEIYKNDHIKEEEIKVMKGKEKSAKIQIVPFQTVVKKGTRGEIKASYTLPPYIQAPMKREEVLSEITYQYGDEILGTSKIYIENDVKMMSLPDIFKEIVNSFCLF